MHVPDIVLEGRPINDEGVEGDESVWPTIRQQFIDECGGKLCVTLARQYETLPGVSECGYANKTFPKELDEMKAGQTVVVYGGAPCPPKQEPPPEDSTSPAGSASSSRSQPAP
ncbi:hypothetical protein ACOKM5_13925 [Streptomyces sp. BH097]|uniref:hypothetical protein n=1 Tax=unclassified Streptomyces TaxID=2593676 RepID=UPI003BB563EA